MKLGPIWQSLLVYNACPQPLTETTVLSALSFFTLHFWQMAQMSDKCLLYKTEKAQISGQTQIIRVRWSLCHEGDGAQQKDRQLNLLSSLGAAKNVTMPIMIIIFCRKFWLSLAPKRGHLGVDRRSRQSSTPMPMLWMELARRTRDVPSEINFLGYMCSYLAVFVQIWISGDLQLMFLVSYLALPLKGILYLMGLECLMFGEVFSLAKW